MLPGGALRIALAICLAVAGMGLMSFGGRPRGRPAPCLVCVGVFGGLVGFMVMVSCVKWAAPCQPLGTG